MSRQFPAEAQKIMNERFNHDTLIALATIENGIPYVRTVDGYYEDGSFYIITYLLSNKMNQIAKNPNVAVSGEWFSGHGIGMNIGHILEKKNEEIANKLRKAFAPWYNNGHINEEDPDTCILRIALSDGVLMAQGTCYNIKFV